MYWKSGQLNSRPIYVNVVYHLVWRWRCTTSQFRKNSKSPTIEIPHWAFLSLRLAIFHFPIVFSFHLPVRWPRPNFYLLAQRNCRVAINLFFRYWNFASSRNSIVLIITPPLASYALRMEVAKWSNFVLHTCEARNASHLFAAKFFVNVVCNASNVAGASGSFGDENPS